MMKFPEVDRLNGRRGAADPALGDPSNDLAERLADLEDRLSIGDHSAARLAAARLRRQFPDDPAVLKATGHACLMADAPAEAIRDLEQSLRLDQTQPDAWYWLAQAHEASGDGDLVLQALDQALLHAPDNLQLDALRTSVAAKTAANWREPLARLVGLQAEHAEDQFVAECLAEVLLIHAHRGWTEVEDEEGGASLTNQVFQLIRHASDSEIPPGWYPTTALQVKTATICLERLQRLPLKDQDLIEGVADLTSTLEDARRRHFRATWAEVFVAVVMLIGTVMLLGKAPLFAIASLAVGVAMLVGSLEPQYRTNRILLSRRKKTLADATLGLVQKAQYGALAYNLFVMGTYPFIAAYKMYVNWGEGWRAKPEILEVLGRGEGADDDSGPAAVEVPLAADARDEPASAPARPLGPEPERETALIGAEHRAPSAARTVVQDPASPDRSLAAFRVAAQARARAWLDALQTWRPRVPKSRIGLSATAVGVLAIAAILVMIFYRQDPADPARASLTNNPAQTDPPIVAQTRPAGPPARSVISGRPTVSNTGALVIDGATLALDGITGEGGIPARQMDSFIHEQGGSVTCEQLANTRYQCRTPGGYDIAAAALVNGAARVSPTAPEDYKAMQAQAVAAGRGIWRQGQ